MNEKESLLIHCLDELEAGVPVNELLARYPEQAESIQPILTVASQLAFLSVDPSPQAQAVAKELFLAQGKAIKQANKRSRGGVVWWRRMAVGFAALVLVMVGMLTLLEGSAAALPGDPLYGVKRTGENVQMMFARDTTVLEEKLQNERQNEIRSLLDAKRSAEVELRGLLEEINDNTWQVSGLPVLLTSDTVVEGDPQVGDQVIVHGITRDGQLIATLIVAEDGIPIIIPSPTMTTTSTPTLAPTATTTATPTTSPTPTLTSTPDVDDEDEEDDTAVDDDDEFEDEETEDPENEDEDVEDPSGDDNGSDDTSDDDSADDSNEDPEDSEEDNSGSGSGENEEEDDDDDNSGSGSSDQDEEDSSDDNSGPGNGSDDDNSGSGSKDDSDDDKSGSDHDDKSESSDDNR